MYLLFKFGDHKYDRLGDINCYIKSFMVTSEKAELTAPLSAISQDFQNKNTNFRIQKSRIRLEEKQEEGEEEHR